SATVLASSCALADAYATMFMAAGGFNAMILCKEIEGIEVYFIFSGNENVEYREYMTPGLESMLSK
ncbi:MAG: FAD:protein FMN transferase, partial [Rikenellaceae bacterium]